MKSSHQPRPPRGGYVFLVQRVGPYHHARLAAWTGVAALPVTVIEFRADETVYAWAPVGESAAYLRLGTRTRCELTAALSRLRPVALVCVGYADPEINEALAWAIRRGVPCVTCSDSTYDDSPRHGIGEWLKRQVVSAFDAALVAGLRSDRYLDHLGIPSDRRFRPWDVVDNGYFASGAEQARRHEPETRDRLGFSGQSFLCVARFVAKKNLSYLITAYGRYVACAPPRPWSLVIVGAGPLEPELRAKIAVARLGDRVQLRGFQQYPELPAFYGVAGAFVLPSLSDQWGLVVNEAMASGLPILVSRRCGCCPDLVREGSNGFSFDPVNVQELAAHLLAMAGLPEERRAEMGRQSSGIIRDYSPEAFAAGLEQAIARIRENPHRRGTSFGGVLASLLARRPAATS